MVLLLKSTGIDAFDINDNGFLATVSGIFIWHYILHNNKNIVSLFYIF